MAIGHFSESPGWDIALAGDFGAAVLLILAFEPYQEPPIAPRKLR